MTLSTPWTASDSRKVTVTTKLYIKLQRKVKRRESTTHCWWYPSYAQWARISSPYSLKQWFLCDYDIKIILLLLLLLRPTTVNVKESLLRLQKRNIEIHVYRLSLSCLHPNPCKLKVSTKKKRDCHRWAIFHWPAPIWYRLYHPPTWRKKGNISRSGGRRSSLPCEELAGSVPNRLNPHLCILAVPLPLHSISCIPSPQYSHTELLSGGQEPKQVAESELSSARGFVQAIAITKEDVMTLQSYRKSPPIAASSRCR